MESVGVLHTDANCAFRKSIVSTFSCTLALRFSTCAARDLSLMPNIPAPSLLLQPMPLCLVVIVASNCLARGSLQYRLRCIGHLARLPFQPQPRKQMTRRLSRTSLTTFGGSLSTDREILEWSTGQLAQDPCNEILDRRPKQLGSLQ